MDVMETAGWCSASRTNPLRRRRPRGGGVLLMLASHQTRRAMTHWSSEAVRVRVPVLVIAGTDDPRTPLDASRRLSAAAPHPKGFWSVPGAAQTNLQRFAPAAYEARLLAFLDHYLRGVTTAEQG